MKQRLTMATIAGESAVVVEAGFRSWRSGADPVAVDRFCAALRDNGQSLPIIYFCEWVDHWLMGDLVPGPEAVEGRRFQAACFAPDKAVAWAAQCGQQFLEQEWLAARLREAVAVWDSIDPRAIVVVREVLGASTLDEEVRASLGLVPEWLQFLKNGTRIVTD